MRPRRHPLAHGIEFRRGNRVTPNPPLLGDKANRLPGGRLGMGQVPHCWRATNSTLANFLSHPTSQGGFHACETAPRLTQQVVRLQYRTCPRTDYEAKPTRSEQRNYHACDRAGYHAATQGTAEETQRNTEESRQTKSCAWYHHGENLPTSVKLLR